MRTASATTPTQIAVASVTWKRTRPHGQPFAPLDLAHGHLDEQEAEHPAGDPELDPRAASLGQEQRQQRQEPDAEEGRGADVDVHRLDDVPEAHDVLAPGVRAGGGDERARDDERERRGDEREGEPRRPERRLGGGAAREVARALHDDERDRERDEGEQEVAHDDQRVELEDDRDPAQDSLGQDGERKHDGAPEEPAGQAGHAEGGAGGDQRRDADGEAHDRGSRTRRRRCSPWAGGASRRSAASSRSRAPSR